jgi:hypothetical protein
MVSIVRNASLQDFEKWLDFQFQKARTEILKQISEADSLASKHGVFQSGRHVIQIIDIIDDGFKSAVQTGLGEMERASSITTLQYSDLRELFIKSTDSFFQAISEKFVARSIYSKGYSQSTESTIDGKLTKIRAFRDFALSQYEIGFLQPVMKDNPMVQSNTLTIQNMNGGQIQQGTTDSSQAVFNVGSIEMMIGKIRKELESTNVSDSIKIDIMADISTIQAQIKKQQPSSSILRECGLSLKRICEGVAISTIAPHLTSLLKNLTMSLGA